ncbi:MAG TPA: WecB/TagA/CpsF family glycosyltransferase [Candidatus Moranbacteria bacterium]|nr:WecB/TagA/CpsF family glycosyltransferase [Candidatus Moranbacteria bacterium]
MHILNIKIDNFSKKEILEKVRSFLAGPKFHQIATINPEIILEAQKNQEFKNILNNCDLNVADGFGIRLAFWRFGKNLKCRFAGADLMLEILKIANEQKLSVFLAAKKDGLSNWEETRDAILKNYPDLEINGENLNFNCHAELVSASHKILNQVQDDKWVLFCNFGAPFQELFINSQKNDTIRLAIGVGGSFDFITKKIRRAPKFMRLIGLEWLWRLILEPRYRFKRIFNAIIIFPIKIIINK